MDSSVLAVATVASSVAAAAILSTVLPKTAQQGTTPAPPPPPPPVDTNGSIYLNSPTNETFASVTINNLPPRDEFFIDFYMQLKQRPDSMGIGPIVSFQNGFTVVGLGIDYDSNQIVAYTYNIEDNNFPVNYFVSSCNVYGRENQWLYILIKLDVQQTISFVCKTLDGEILGSLLPSETYFRDYNQSYTYLLGDTFGAESFNYYSGKFSFKGALFNFRVTYGELTDNISFYLPPAPETLANGTVLLLLSDLERFLDNLVTPSSISTNSNGAVEYINEYPTIT
jgi:hypothetical protein